MGVSEYALEQGLLGRCAAMEELRRQIGTFGESELRVHIFGETGTGKERVARALHAASPRRHGRFVPFNAAGFTDDLVEAELFGHGRGAFTGAVGEREGFVRAAEGGTLFLDEVGELTPRAQAKLLRYLQEREYCRLGETTPRPSNVLVLSATNVDLARRVQEGRFRSDLWFRLEDARVVVPPLRERGDDVLLLARHFLRRDAARWGRPCPALTAEAEEALMRFSWPGNVRQLESVMRRAQVIAGGAAVDVCHLSCDILEAVGERWHGRLRTALHAFEREYVQRALERHRGVRTAAAAELGITRQALVNKIRRLGV